MTSEQNASTPPLDQASAPRAGSAVSGGVLSSNQRLECNACDWKGPRSEAVHFKHDASVLLCPECKETTMQSAPLAPNLRLFSFSSRGMVEDKDGLWINKDDPALASGMTAQIENVARWLENKCDPFHAARELRLIVQQMRPVETTALVSVKDEREIEELRAALKVAKQALAEFSHAQECGPEWYTRGESGMYAQVRLWMRRGHEAISKALGPYDDNGRYLKEMPPVEPSGHDAGIEPCKCDTPEAKRACDRDCDGHVSVIPDPEQCPAIDGPHRAMNGVCIHCRAQVKASERECSWGCHYVGAQFIRYAACTVHGASSSENGPGEQEKT